MKKISNAKFFSIISVMMALLLMVLLFFALGNTTGNLLKSLTYGFAVGNLGMTINVCQAVWKKE